MISRELREYSKCIFFHMILPLVPLVLELLATAIASGQPRVSVQSLTLSGAMYSVTIGITSESKATFGFMVVVGLLNAVAFGTVAALVAIHQTINYEGLIKAASIICIALIFCIHAYERYGRHITDGRPFWRETDDVGTYRSIGGRSRRVTRRHYVNPHDQSEEIRFLAHHRLLCWCPSARSSPAESLLV